jgi:hypothetical protein
LFFHSVATVSYLCSLTLAGDICQSVSGLLYLRNLSQLVKLDVEDVVIHANNVLHPLNDNMHMLVSGLP